MEGHTQERNRDKEWMKETKREIKEARDRKLEMRRQKNEGKR
jgi:hypothetical protein